MKYIKSKKNKPYDKIISEQKQFIYQCEKTLELLTICSGSHSSKFFEVFGEDVLAHYEFKKHIDTPEHMWECIDEFTSELIYGYRNFKIKNGKISFAKTKKESVTEKEVIKKIINAL